MSLLNHQEQTLFIAVIMISVALVSLMILMIYQNIHIFIVPCITSCDRDNGRLHITSQVFLFCEINSCFIYIYILDFFIMSFLFHLHSYYLSDSYDSMGYDLCTFHKEV